MEYMLFKRQSATSQSAEPPSISVFGLEGFRVVGLGFRVWGLGFRV
jgi:hypothetical protein